MDTFRNIRDGGIQKVANSSERLALIPSDGDIVEQLDNNSLYAYKQSTNSWVLLTSGGGGGGAVSSVFNRTGDVVAQSGDYTKAQVGLGNVDNTSDLNKPISNATQAALDDKEDLVNKATNLNSPDNITYPTTLAVSNAITTIDNTFNAMKEPTGLPNRTDSTISFNASTRQFSISPTSTSFDVWIKGVKYTKNSTNSITISTTAGNHYIYFDSTGTLTETTTFNVSLFSDNAMVSIVYWNSDNNTAPYFADERHGMQMDGATHGYLHTVFGTRYLTGLALQGFTADGTGNVNTNAQFTADSGTIRDEDILLTIAAQTQIPILYRQGSLWRKKTADAYPLIYNGTAGYTGTRIPYNQFITGNWQLTEATDTNYVLVHFFATNDVNNGVVGIIGTNQYPNAPQARAAVETEISSLSGLPFAEFTAIGSVIFETRASYTNVPKARVVSSDPSISEIYVDFRGEQLYTPSGVATSHSLLSNLNSDDHIQYFNQNRADARYLQLTGGTLTGSITATNLSGTNTGDETNATIKTKLGAATSSNDGYLSSTDWSTFNNKQPTITGAATTITSSDLTANRVLLSNSSGKVAASSVTDTTLGYLDATSSIQTQLNNKVDKSGDTMTGQLTVNDYIVSKNLNYIPPLGANEFDYSLRFQMGSASILNGVNGQSVNTSGTIALAGFSSASFIGKIPHVTFSSSSTAGSTTGVRTAVTYFCVGGGFRFRTIFMIDDAATVAGARMFCGMSSSSAATAINSSTNNNQIVTSLTNFFCFGYDGAAGDSKFYIYHNGATAGSTTKITLNNNFSITSGADIYSVEFYNEVGSNSVLYTIRGLISGNTENGVITTNLPSSVQLYAHSERFNGTTASAVRFQQTSLGLYSFG